jgi:hypothetical protein
MLPKDMRDKVWALYRPGQEKTKNPSMEYLNHAMECVKYVADKEFGNVYTPRNEISDRWSPI